jgi:hypothetical protein
MVGFCPSPMGLSTAFSVISDWFFDGLKVVNSVVKVGCKCRSMDVNYLGLELSVFGWISDTDGTGMGLECCV